MKLEQIQALTAMPIAKPLFPAGPWEFTNREYFIIRYRSDAKAIRAALPEPLQPDDDGVVLYEFIRMPDSHEGFGNYTESGVVIPAKLFGKPVNYTAQMYLDSEAPIAAGREIWGFPKKFGQPKLRVKGETLTGKLKYNGVTVATGTMTYKQRNVGGSQDKIAAIARKMGKTQVNLKLIPSCTGKGFDVLQLVGYQLQNLQVKEAYEGDAALHLVPHSDAPVASLPVVEVLGAVHYLADLVLPFGEVLHDYLKAA
jgi:acetoacetate decarboxylase